jgi:hypothetical protein
VLAEWMDQTYFCAAHVFTAVVRGACVFCSTCGCCIATLNGLAMASVWTRFALFYCGLLQQHDGPQKMAP